ncbi:hypothetical protein [Vibrio crassostreae]|uniref:hypothetical protein n=1 Tax=Vibrio crassostreae TaxID=246167 RepID=UPI001B313F49|nr:hypothetical protein [Vibrio crassostreae]
MTDKTNEVIVKLHTLNKRCNYYLTGLLGLSMTGLIFFKILMVDFADYSNPVIEPVLLVVSALSTVLCINGWLLSPTTKILFTIGSLSYVSFPLLARVFSLPILTSDVSSLDAILSGEISLTFIALFAIVAYNSLFQSFQVAMIFWVKSKKGSIIECIDEHLIPYEKASGVSFTSLNKTLKLKMLLHRGKPDMTTTLLLLRDKVPSMMVSTEFTKG